jgi:hypothetical protein
MSPGGLDPNEFIASFSNVGVQIAIIAPGVGVLSTLPDNGYGACSGTSMAAPVVTGAIASLLSRRPDICGMPRNRARSDAIRQLLIDNFLKEYYPEAMKVQRWGALIPSVISSGFWRQRCAGQNWALIGDAAGHVDPVTGIGISYALASTNLVARAILCKDVESYDRVWRDEYGERLEQSSGTMERFFRTGDVAGFEQEIKMGLRVNHLIFKQSFDNPEGAGKANNQPGEPCEG